MTEPTAGPAADSLALARQVAAVLEEHKASDIVLLDLRPEGLIADFFVIASGSSARQLRALSEHIQEGARQQAGRRIMLHREGEATSGWILLDYGAVIVHLFLPEQRAYYDLESLWEPATQLLLKIQ
ncbi:MAG: ribosome silencing factor [Chloroflexi bacterium]|nr:ribosome silencing factor [Chloroflexota bacterium]